MTASSVVMKTPSSLLLSVLGATLIIGPLLFYRILILGSLPVSIQTAGMLERIAYSTLCLVILGLVLTLLGLTRFLLFRGLDEERHDSESLLLILSSVLREKRYIRVFMVAAVAYGLLFVVTSGTVVYQTGTNFSTSYGINVPAFIAVTCCGPTGQMPQFVFYLTQQFAVLLVPSNLILVSICSWLVGLNGAMMAYAYKYRASMVGRKWLGSFGALTGLFSACPTCAGLFFLTSLGLGGTFSSSFASSNLQIPFIAIAIPLLVVAPILACRQIRAVKNGTCSLPDASLFRASKC